MLRGPADDQGEEYQAQQGRDLGEGGHIGYDPPESHARIVDGSEQGQDGEDRQVLGRDHYRSSLQQHVFQGDVRYEVTEVRGADHGDGGQRAGTDHGGFRPPVEKGHVGGIGFPQVHNDAACAGHHGAQFGEAQRTREAEQAADDPDQQKQFGGAQYGRNTRGRAEYAGSDDAAYDDRRGRDQAKIPGQFGLELKSASDAIG